MPQGDHCAAGGVQGLRAGKGTGSGLFDGMQCVAALPTRNKRIGACSCVFPHHRSTFTSTLTCAPLVASLSPPPPRDSPTQVRHYYYRLIKRLNRIMGAGSALDTKNPLQVHRSMIKFWEVVSRSSKLNNHMHNMHISNSV